MKTKIFNKQNYFTNEQIQKIFKLLPETYLPRRIYIMEQPSDIDDFKATLLLQPSYFEILANIDETIYIPFFDWLFVFVFAQDYEDYTREDQQLYSIYSMIWACRHKFNLHKFKNEQDKNEDCRQFAKTFMDEHSAEISDIMRFEDEWEVDECDEDEN